MMMDLANNPWIYISLLMDDACLSGMGTMCSVWDILTKSLIR